jgi:rhodanese-related sulfurtransferase
MNKPAKTSSLIALLVLLLLSTIASAQEKSANAPARAQREPMLVTVDWLADHLKDPSLVLLQIGDKKDYDKGHIPGAQFLEYESISTPHGQGLMLELPPVEQLVSKNLASRTARTLFCISERIG